MKKYIILSTSRKAEKSTELRVLTKFLQLQVNHSIWGTPLRYSEDAILAAYQPGRDACVYDRFEEAVAMLIYSAFAAPIFEVELLNSSVLFDDCCSKSGDIFLGYKLTSTDNITKLISARHAGITYDLSKVWAQRQQLYIESSKLNDKYNATADRTDLKTQIGNLLKLVESLQGNLSYAELTDIIKKTNEFLEKSSFYADNAGKMISFSDIQPYIPITEYRELAKTKQGAPSLAMQTLGLCMLTLAAALVSMGFGLVPGAVLALSGLGFFAAGKRETGVCKAMNDLAMGRAPGL